MPEKSLDPGNLKTPLYQHIPAWQRWVVNFGLKDPIYGAYTELFAGLGQELSMADAGRFSKYHLVLLVQLSSLLIHV